MLLPDEQIKTLLLDSRIIDEKKLTELIHYAANAQESLQEAAIEKDIITDEKLGLLIATHLNIPFVTLAKMTIPEDIFRIVPQRLARKYKVISFANDADGVKLAMADPQNKNFLEMIGRKTQRKVNAYLATERDIENTLQIYRIDLRETFGELTQESSTQNSDAV